MSVITPIHSASVPNLKKTTFAARAFPFRVYVESYRHISTMHWHDYTQLWYTISGSYTQTINGKKIEQTAGSLSFIPPFALHCVDVSSIDTDNTRIICISIFEDLFSKNIMPFRPLSYTASAFDKMLLTPYIKLTGKDKARADELFEHARAEYSRRYEMNQKSIFADISNIFELMAKTINSKISPAKLERASEQLGIISEAANLITESCTSGISVPEIAKQAHLSPSVFSNKFKNCTGQTVHSLYNRTRIKRVIFLLRFSQKTLPEIADECGFYDSTHLSHTLKSALGISPTEFRAQMLRRQLTRDYRRYYQQKSELEWLNVMSAEEMEIMYKGAHGIPFL